MSKRLRGLMAALVGLATLAALGLALVAVLGPQGRVPVAQAPYPLGTSPPAPRVPETPQATRTPGPYPPPPIYPTMTPWPTTTPWPTPEPPPPPKPIGLQIVWSEKAKGEQVGPWEAFTFYMADVGDITNRKALYTTPPCRGVKASLSSDGSTVAFTTYSSSHPTNNGTLWVMRLDEGQPRDLAQGMDAQGPSWVSYPAWSCDSHSLAYVRHTPRQSPLPDKESSPTRPELHVISVNAQENKTLFAEDDVRPSLLGWTPEGRILYTLTGDRPDVKYGLWSVDVVSGERTFITALLPGEKPQLAPDGRRLLFWTTEGLVSLSSDGRERKNVEFPGIVVTSADTKIVADVSWAANSSEVIFRTGEASWRIGNLDTGAVRDITVAPELLGFIDHLISVSPDGQWLLMEQYASGGFSLLPVGSHYRITIADENSAFRFAGWSLYNPGGGT